MEKAYDFSALLELMKEGGLNLLEDEVKLAVRQTFVWLKQSAELSATPFDDMLAVAYPKVEELALGLTDKIDGKEG